MDTRKKAVFNWSGGKDSALALHKALQQNQFDVIALLTTVNEGTQLSSMHAIPHALLVKQAESIGIPLYPVFLPKNRKLYEKIKAHLRIFEAEELIDKQVCNLSGGQLQRVLLALAVMDEPNLLLLDEPVSGIDQNGMELFFKTMDYLKKHYDLAIILISHDLDYVARYADHVVLLDKTVLRQGTVKEVYESSEFERIFSAGKEETWIKEDETND